MSIHSIYLWLPTILISLERMDSNQERSLWSHWPSAWPETYQPEDEAFFSSLPFPSLCPQPLGSIGSTVTHSNVLQDELAFIFDDDVLRFCDDVGQTEYKCEESEKRLPLMCHTEKGGISTIRGSGRVRAEEKVLTFEIVSQYFYMPITQAARELNIGLTVLKKKCRELGIPRWPHRKMKSLQTLINNVQVLQEAGKADGEEQLRAVVEMLQQERKLLEEKPYVELDEKTKRLRQACFKANHKKRRILALEAGDGIADAKQLTYD